MVRPEILLRAYVLSTTPSNSFLRSIDVSLIFSKYALDALMLVAISFTLSLPIVSTATSMFPSIIALFKSFETSVTFFNSEA